jgi:hypothetical protein
MSPLNPAVVRVTYTKHFMSGLLCGLSVPASFPVPAAQADVTVELLSRCTPAHPGRDAITRNLFHVSAISTTPV